MVAVAKKLKAKAIGLTDHGNCSGVIEFYKKCKKADLKAIMGMEGYFVDDRALKDKDHRKSYHICLYAKDNEGLSNLFRISTEAYQSGFYYKPRLDWTLLEKYRKGLIVTSGCLIGMMSDAILEGDTEKALKVGTRLKEMFGEDFYIEQMLHPNSEKYQSDLYEKQVRVVAGLQGIAKKLDVKCIITNDAHYNSPQDFVAHDVLLCIGTKDYIDNPKRFTLEIPEFYIKDRKTLVEVFSTAGIRKQEGENWLDNTLEIEEKVNVTVDFSPKFPKFTPPEGFSSSFEYFKHCLKNGYAKRIGGKVENESVYQERLKYEHNTIAKLGYVDYMLVVADYIQYARNKGVLIGPGRGSVAGSLVAYLLDITCVDPIKYNLPFERFINPFRVSPPDIDTDFMASRRDEVRSYISSKYPAANIGTFGTLGPRAVVHDVCRVMKVDNDRMESILNSIPDVVDEKDASKNMSLREAYQKKLSSSLMKLVEENKPLFDIIFRIEGLVRHSGIHAAGIVIADRPLEGFIPLRIDKGFTIAQFNDKTCEELGLLKIDVLGLKMLDTIHGVMEEIKQKGEELELEQLPLGDAKVWECIQQGRTLGCFQLESDTMRRLAGQLRPVKIQELAAMIALFRPGPSRSGMTDEYVRNKANPSRIKYSHPKLEEALRETYGIIVFQETVMEIAQKLAGFTIAESDELRRAIGKQLPEEMRKYFDKFTEGCVKNGVPERVARDMCAQFTQHAVYSFNRAHSISYAILAYWSVYLKVHFPLYFCNSFLNSEDEGRQAFIQESRMMGVEYLAPDINKSENNFSIEENKIRVGLSKLKFVGEGSSEHILSGRTQQPYTSFIDFCNKVNLSKVNTHVVKMLIQYGCFDSLGYDRIKLVSVVEEIFKNVRKIKVGKSKTTLSQLEVLIKEGKVFPPLRNTPYEYLAKHLDTSIISQGVGERVLGWGEGNSLWDGETKVPIDKELTPPAPLSLYIAKGKRDNGSLKVEQTFEWGKFVQYPRSAQTLYNKMKTHCVGCTDCELRKTARQVVFGEGTVGGVMIVGEGPGEVEDKNGRPFVGQAGEKLRRTIRELGDPPFYITNVVKCRCVTPKGDNRTPTSKDWRECIKWLHREIILVQPKVVCGLGGIALQALLGLPQTQAAITKHRGMWQDLEVYHYKTKFTCTYHPAYLLRNEGDVSLFETFKSDLKRAFDYAIGTHNTNSTS